MKYFFAAILGIAMISCSAVSDFDESDVKNETRDFYVTSFSRLDLGGPFNVILKQGDSEKVVIDAPVSVLEKIEVMNTNSTLKIDFNEGFNHSRNRKINVYVTLRSVNYIKMGSAGNVETRNTLALDTLTIENNRTGNMQLDLGCKIVNLNSKSTGNTTLSGNANSAVYNWSGVGNFDAWNLKVEYLKVNNSGVGNTDVFASKELYLVASGIGNVTYGGGAQIKKLETSGIGNVSRR